MTFAMPVLFLIIFAFQAHGISAVVWQSLIWCGWFMSVVESNGLAYDGRGFTMEVIAGVRGPDRQNRPRTRLRRHHGRLHGAALSRRHRAGRRTDRTLGAAR